MPTLTWLGHATFLVADGAHTVIIDPFLADNPVASRTPVGELRLSLNVAAK